MATFKKHYGWLSADLLKIIAGQVISIFGNTLLRFAIPLYLLNRTGSSAVFGTVSGLALIPYLVCSPLGGVLADRTPKKIIMYRLDFITGSLILGYALLLENVSPVPLSLAVLMLLYAIQGLYAPSVTASMPYLVEKQDMMQASGLINTVNSLANLVGPGAAGLLYGLFGILPMLCVSTVCFLISALLEVSIRLCETLPQMEKRPHVFREIAGTLRYIVKEQRSIWETALVALTVNAVLGALINLAFPVIVTTMLGFGEAEGSLRFGYLESAMALGALFGSLGAGVFARRFRPRNLMWVLMFIGFPLAAGGLGLIVLPHGIELYYLLLSAAAIGMFFNGILNVQISAYLQILSPPEQMGRIIGCLSVVIQLGQPAGMLIYGWLMELAGERVGLLFLGSFVVFALFLSRTGRPFLKLDEKIALAKKQHPE